jgi:hypothetical protein
VHRKEFVRRSGAVAALAATALCLGGPQAVAAPVAAPVVTGGISGAPVSATPGSTAAASSVQDCQDICVLGVRAATHPGFDRFVIDLGEGTIPQWTTSLQVGGHLTMGEGAVMPIEGAEYLKLTLHRATTFDFTAGTSVYTSPRYQTYAFPSLKGQGQFQYTDASAREFHMGLALGEYSSYRVFTLTAPHRIVIDVNH